MISIITPTYNSEKFIRQTVQSLKDQINKDFEHIVVDAGSTDNTKEICINGGISKFFLLENSSMYEAIDFGFRQSSGDILCWLNSDDLFLPDTTEYVNEFFSKNGTLNIIAGNTIYIDEHDAIMYRYRFPKIPKTIFKSFGTLYLCQPSVFWRRKIYFDNGGLNLDYRLSADRDFIFRVLNSEELIYVNKFLSKFRIHPKNLSRTKANDAKEEENIIDQKLNVGPITFVNQLLSIAGHAYIKLCNPEMILWKTRKFLNLK